MMNSSKACTQTLTVPHRDHGLVNSLFTELSHHHIRLQSQQEGLTGIKLTISCTLLQRLCEHQSAVTT